MALIDCWECKKPVSSAAGSCPHCGAPVSKDSTPGTKKTESSQVNVKPVQPDVLSCAQCNIELVPRDDYSD